MLTVDVLSDADADDAFALSAGEGWNQTVADWKRLTQLEPTGCFAARDNGRMVATVTTITYGSALAWIGMMVVHADYRRRGIGAALMQRALDHALDSGVGVVKLDATPAGRPLYESLGFTAEAELERWQGLARRLAEPDRSLASDDRDAMSSLDASAYGANRSRLLGSLVRDAASSPLVARSDGGRPVGYSLARRGRQATYLGPVVATIASAATHLFHGMVERHVGAEVCLDHHVGSHLPASVLEDRGLVRRRSLLRMRLGPQQSPGTPPSLCASAGPELG